MHQNREEAELGGGTFLGYSPFKDLSLSHPWGAEVQYGGIIPAGDRSSL